MAEIVIDGVAKHFDSVEALRHIDITIADGEFMVLLGPSGCGKTTLLRMIAGLETPSSGRILIGGTDVTALPPARRGVGMVFQNYALYPHMTVRENIALGLKVRGLDRAKIEQRIAFAANLVQIGEYLERRPRALSGGQRQRVALARVIAREPAVSLMDEPLSNIDAQLRTIMRAELLRIHRAVGMTTIYVTHDQEEAMGLGDRITVMNFGHIEQIGSPDEVYGHPANAFVARFIGSPRMNLVRVDRHPGAAMVETPFLRVPVPDGIAISPEVLVGFRSEDARPGAAEEGETEVRGQVDVVEHLGAQIELHFRTEDGQEVVVRRPRGENQWREGERIVLAIPPKSVHFFDAGTGAALTVPVS